MKINTFNIGTKEVTEVDDVVVRTPQDMLDIMANVSTNYIVLHEHNFEKEFFDLKTGVLGEVLLKCTNYRVYLAIIGDFSQYESKALKAFIYESNKHRDYLFVSSLDEVKKIWSE